ncbi:hypothetical protein RclHR1_00050020 [Rhizophagus clarus]|uniref:Uncharacterized protein n=1 Tax=Rhizophagus clarus TaxID=94130 RepID=A0A2Z6S341_9GLOM|nr:hypothetical protein RclHR1_00050020 [Rhizophagus clarus]GES86182.1 hypothetical protein RCL_e19981_RclHR1_00050020 [Rhizophagus clarus]
MKDTVQPMVSIVCEYHNRSRRSNHMKKNLTQISSETSLLNFGNNYKIAVHNIKFIECLIFRIKIDFICNYQ